MSDTQPVLVTGAQAARRCNMDKATFAARVKKHGIQPDAILHNGSGVGESPLYALERLSEIRRIITSPTPA